MIKIPLLSKLPFYRRYSTKSLSDAWKNRKIDWKKEYQNSEDPHRKILTWMLGSMNCASIWEVGCGGGANLIRILKDLPNRQIGGSDVNEEAIKLCHETFSNPDLFRVESGDNLSLSDKSTEVVFSDMVLIYVGPFKIDAYLKEMKRVARKYILLVEKNNTSFWSRQWERLTGHHSYDYRKRLEKLGCYDIMIQDMPNMEAQIITARIP